VTVIAHDLTERERAEEALRLSNRDLEQFAYVASHDLQQPLRMVSSGDLPTLLADRVQLVQLFQNLVGNAVKFHGERPPRVGVEAGREAGRWHFTVADEGIGIGIGIGIDPEYRDRIFVIFQHLHAASEYDGSGIGLAVCKRIVERHGGRIWVESGAGEGTIFNFTIADQGGAPC